MSKDPAILFYPNDYIGGTMGMTFEEKGAYMELLVLQFNRGHMGGHMIGQTVGQLWDKIQDKFVQDENGLWYNVRFEQEIIKRKKYTESRRNNISGINQHSEKGKKESSKPQKKVGHMDGHMTSHMENENRNEIIVPIIDVLGEGMGEETPKSWREDFQVYKQELDQVYYSLLNDQEFILQQQEFYPKVDIQLSLKKAYTNFWGKEAGWKHKKKEKSKTIDWKATLTNSINFNKVYKADQPTQKGTSIEDMQQILLNTKNRLENASNGNQETLTLS